MFRDGLWRSRFTGVWSSLRLWLSLYIFESLLGLVKEVVEIGVLRLFRFAGPWPCRRAIIAGALIAATITASRGRQVLVLSRATTS
jgi:hypothetical protein